MISALAEQTCKRDVTILRSSSISWRCSKIPELSVRLPDSLWLFPPSHPEQRIQWKKGFLLWVLSASALFNFLFSKHSGATVLGGRRHALPCALKEVTKHTSLVLLFHSKGNWGTKEKQTTHRISWNQSEEGGKLQKWWECSLSSLKTRQEKPLNV